MLNHRYLNWYGLTLQVYLRAADLQQDQHLLHAHLYLITPSNTHLDPKYTALKIGGYWARPISKSDTAAEDFGDYVLSLLNNNEDALLLASIKQAVHSCYRCL